MRDDSKLEEQIAALLADPQYEGHPAREALAALMQRSTDQLVQLERLTSISDGYQSAMRERNQTLNARYRKQIRQLGKIVRISDHYQKMLRDLNEALKVASLHDPLTELPNRRLITDRLNAEASLVERGRPPFALALADVDRFKQINDDLGHDVGDVTLVAVSRALNDGLRAYDVCARWGGEEFLVFLPEASGEHALEITERLRLSVETLKPPALPADIKVTISIGVASHRAGSTVADTIKRADDALYEAKRKGRNCIVLGD